MSVIHGTVKLFLHQSHILCSRAAVIWRQDRYTLVTALEISLENFTQSSWRLATQLLHPHAQNFTTPKKNAFNGIICHA
jgi:hypothetical protein